MFQPDPIILAFLPVKQGLFLLALLPLALLRGIVARRAARTAALVALALAVLGLLARYLPELLNVYGGPLVRAAGAWRNLLGGMGMNLLAALPLLASAVLPGRRWWAIDAVHVLLLAGLLGLWAYSLWG
ncbi:hypothetical protein OG2516_01691 [Oceanicola granulosus HTCC2516]|uniref:Uncharacterized protein n=1 Tax=Oceanicola granulosus (strain ATCC BAA-861 / DSM 15982 / KCTC 12143 / HTCC2516) TaxID=314256 RepID=Q2CFV1_OCEGH|nr:hypothetical protein [Oceanicola granulosus]EAR51591.1 hypothetical protein OG2516_01691 [Oceanicola granulosus HTCC2516]